MRVFRTYMSTKTASSARQIPVNEMSNPTSTEVPSALITQQYILSRGVNLITNGNGLLGDNTNFSALTFDPVDTAAGGGSFKRLAGNSNSFTSDEFIPVNPMRYYRLYALLKAGDIGGGNFDAANKQYFGYMCYDIDKLQIYPYMVMKYAGSTDTTLAADLVSGVSTTMTLTSAAGWSTSALGHTRNISWWPYTNSKGYTYEDYTYTRNTSLAYSDFTTNGLWATSGISGNVITLRSVWTGPTLAAGTKIRNASSGSGGRYLLLAGGTVPNAWTPYNGIIGEYETTGGISDYSKFLYGTAYIKIYGIPNYTPTAGNTIRYNDIWLSEVPTGLFQPDSYSDSDENVKPNSLFYSTTQNGLTYKDDTGVIHKIQHTSVGKYVKASDMWASTTNGAALVKAEMATNKQNSYTYDFDTTTQEFIEFTDLPPDTWDAGTITAKFYWMHPATTTNFGVVWTVEARAYANTNALDQAWGTSQKIADTGGTTSAVYISGSTPAVTVGGTPAIGQLIHFRVKRAPSDASDTLAVDAKLIGCLITYSVT